MFEALDSITPDRVEHCLRTVHETLSCHGLWHCVVYGTLLGAVRDEEIIPWDYDFDLLVRVEDCERILAVGRELASGLHFEEHRAPASHLAVNPGGLTSFKTSAIDVFHEGEKVGDLYQFSLFADGVLRRFDFENRAYWCPHSSFPHFFVDRLSEAKIRGRTYPAIGHPELFLAGVYGEDWRVPYRAVTQGGQWREGVTSHSDRYEPKLHREIAWCEAQGWDRSRYEGCPTWPTPINGAGPIGPCPRTIDSSRALWWRDLAELAEYF